MTPQGADGGNFQNETQTLSIPVTVQAVASFSREHVAWGRYALLTLGVLVVAGGLGWRRA
jgi:hypothetical protein